MRLEEKRKRWREASKRYYRKHRAECLESKKKYYQKHREQEIDRVSRWQKQNPHKHRAHVEKYNNKHKTQKAVRLQAWRRIALGDKCEVCGSTENLQRHHPDYTKPLEVQTLCSRCHGELHSAPGG